MAHHCYCSGNLVMNCVLNVASWCGPGWSSNPSLPNYKACDLTAWPKGNTLGQIARTHHHQLEISGRTVNCHINYRYSKTNAATLPPAGDPNYRPSERRSRQKKQNNKRWKRCSQNVCFIRFSQSIIMQVYGTSFDPVNSKSQWVFGVRLLGLMLSTDWVTQLCQILLLNVFLNLSCWVLKLDILYGFGCPVAFKVHTHFHEKSCLWLSLIFSLPLIRISHHLHMAECLCTNRIPRKYMVTFAWMNICIIPRRGIALCKNRLTLKQSVQGDVAAARLLKLKIEGGLNICREAQTSIPLCLTFPLMYSIHPHCSSGDAKRVLLLKKSIAVAPI